MFCPNCGKEMTLKGLSIHHCDDCNIDYNEYTHVWVVPEQFQPSMKQQKAASIIHCNLGVPLPPPVKKTYWNYINRYMDESKIKANEVVDLDFDFFLDGVFDPYY